MCYLCSPFRWSDLLLNCYEPKKLVQCRWPKVKPVIYVAYRIILAIYTLTSWILGINFMPKFSFIYLTNWGYSILTLNFFVKAVNSVIYFKWLNIEAARDTGDNVMIESPTQSDTIQLPGDDEDIPLISGNSRKGQTIPVLLQFSWLLTNISTSVGIMISLVFWIILYPFIDDQPASFENIQAHGLNSVLLLLDVCLIAVPIRMHHVYQPVTFGVMYGAFSAIYWGAGGLNPFGTKPIYPIVVWDKVSPTAYVTVGIFVLVTLLHFLITLLSTWLDRIARKQIDAMAPPSLPQQYL